MDIRRSVCDGACCRRPNRLKDVHTIGGNRSKDRRDPGTRGNPIDDAHSSLGNIIVAAVSTRPADRGAITRPRRLQSASILGRIADALPARAGGIHDIDCRIVGSSDHGIVVVRDFGMGVPGDIST